MTKSRMTKRRNASRAVVWSFGIGTSFAHSSFFQRHQIHAAFRTFAGCVGNHIRVHRAEILLSCRRIRGGRGISFHGRRIGFGRRGHWHERHAALRTLARFVGDNLGMHRAGIELCGFRFRGAGAVFAGAEFVGAAITGISVIAHSGTFAGLVFVDARVLPASGRCSKAPCRRAGFFAAPTA